MTTESADCPICIDKYTVQLRKPVKCQYCDFTACVVCLKRYLVEGLLDAHCMDCKREWNDEFLDLNFTKAFRTGIWKKHREEVLLDREMAILPSRQTRVEATIKLRGVQTQMSELNKKIAELETQKTLLMRKGNQYNVKLTRYYAESEGRAPPAWTLEEGERGTKPSAERAKFIMKCPDTECRGFLSTAYKCGTCQKWCCPDCLEVKGADKDAEHTCNEEKKASVALIIKESKPCPKCGERISKVDGCDQMFCVECHTAFSWTTGQQVHGVIHNPHYYEFLRKQGNGVAPRNAGDIPCGGLPYYHTLLNSLSRVSKFTQNIIISIHRITAEINDERLGRFQGHFDANDNGDLGVKYLLKEMNKEEMKAELVKRENKRNKHLAIRGILEMFVTTSTMMLIEIVNNPPKSEEEFKDRMTAFQNLKSYANENLLRVSKMKSCSVPQIGNSRPDVWTWIPFAKYVAPPKATKEKEENSSE